MAGKVSLRKEIVVTVVNRIGALADMSAMLAKQGVNIEAIAGYAQADNTADIMLVTNNNLGAIDALKNAGYNSIKENEVVVAELENKPGALQQITAKLAREEIDIKYVYGAVCSKGCPSTMVISTTDNKTAEEVFR